MKLNPNSIKIAIRTSNSVVKVIKNRTRIKARTKSEIFRLNCGSCWQHSSVAFLKNFVKKFWNDPTYTNHMIQDNLKYQNDFEILLVLGIIKNNSFKI